jgi:hypothetical protein
MPQRVMILTKVPVDRGSPMNTLAPFFYANAMAQDGHGNLDDRKDDYRHSFQVYTTAEIDAARAEQADALAKGLAGAKKEYEAIDGKLRDELEKQIKGLTGRVFTDELVTKLKQSIAEMIDAKVEAKIAELRRELGR